MQIQTLDLVAGYNGNRVKKENLFQSRLQEQPHSEFGRDRVKTGFVEGTLTNLFITVPVLKSQEALQSASCLTRALGFCCESSPKCSELGFMGSSFVIDRIMQLNSTQLSGPSLNSAKYLRQAA